MATASKATKRSLKQAESLSTKVKVQRKADENGEIPSIGYEPFLLPIFDLNAVFFVPEKMRFVCAVGCNLFFYDLVLNGSNVSFVLKKKTDFFKCLKGLLRDDGHFVWCESVVINAFGCNSHETLAFVKLTLPWVGERGSDYDGTYICIFKLDSMKVLHFFEFCDDTNLQWINNQALAWVEENTVYVLTVSGNGCGKFIDKAENAINLCMCNEKGESKELKELKFEKNKKIQHLTMVDNALEVYYEKGKELGKRIYKGFSFDKMDTFDTECLGIKGQYAPQSDKLLAFIDDQKASDEYKAKFGAEKLTYQYAQNGKFFAQCFLGKFVQIWENKVEPAFIEVHKSKDGSFQKNDLVEQVYLHQFQNEHILILVARNKKNKTDWYCKLYLSPNLKKKLGQ